MAESKRAKTVSSKSPAKARRKKPAQAAGRPKVSAAAQSTAARTATVTRRRAASRAKSPAVLPTEEQIATRAYEIWQRRGKPVGYDQQNWYDAIQELQAACA